MFGRFPDACICIVLGLLMLGLGDDMSKIPGHWIYAFLSVATSAICFGVAAFLTWPTSAR